MDGPIILIRPLSPLPIDNRSALDSQDDFSLLQEIEKTFCRAENQLFVEKQLSDEMMTLFEQAMIGLRLVFNKSYWKKKESPSLFLKKIFLLQSFEKKVTTIIIKTLNLEMQCRPFNKDIIVRTLTHIDTIIESLLSVPGKAAALISTIGETQKLKIFEKREILKSYSFFKKEFNIKEKQFFHLIGNHLEINELELKQLHPDVYCGSIEIFALKSWRKIIKGILADNKNIESDSCKKVLEILDASFFLSLQSLFAHMHDCTNEDEKEISFLNDFINMSSGFEGSKTEPYKLSELFFKKYQTKNQNSLLPFSVVLNEMTWIFVDHISQMKNGEERYLEMGLTTHAIGVVIRCHEAASASDEGDYDYLLYNTGLGANLYHLMDSSQQKVHPIIFRKLPLKAFNYQFFRSLFNLKFIEQQINESDQIDLFYQLNEKNFEEHHSRKENFEDYQYLLQIFGTCTFTALEAYILYRIGPLFNSQCTLHKTQFAIKKIKKEVTILSDTLNQKEPIEIKQSQSVVLPTKASAYPSAHRWVAMEKIIVRLRNAKVLLKMGEQFSESLNK